MDLKQIHNHIAGDYEGIHSASGLRALGTHLLKHWQGYDGKIITLGAIDEAKLNALAAVELRFFIASG